MHVVHTAAAPPNQGRMYLPSKSWTQNRRKALRKIVIPNGALWDCGVTARGQLNKAFRPVHERFASCSSRSLLSAQRSIRKLHDRAKFPFRLFATPFDKSWR